MLLKSLKSGQTMKISSALGNHTNLMDNKQDGTLSYKTMASFYNTFWKRQIQE